MSIRMLRRWVGRIPGSRWLYSMLVRSSGSWIFHDHRVAWLSRSPSVAGFPALYRAFAIFCRVAPRFRGRVVGAETLHRVTGLLTNLLGLRDSAVVRVADTTIYLQLTDPRSLIVPLELERSPEIRLLRSLLAPGDTFIDVGANHGSFSVVAAHLVGPTGLIVAFEPQPHLSNLIRRSLEEAGEAPFLVKAIACSDYDGEAEFFVPRATSGSAGLNAAFSSGMPNKVLKVPVGRFDKVVDWANFPGRLLIKLDVEGSERAFLRGAARALRERHPMILMEINPTAIEASRAGPEADLLATLLELGYTQAQEVEAQEPQDLREIDWTKQRNVFVS